MGRSDTKFMRVAVERGYLPGEQADALLAEAQATDTPVADLAVARGVLSQRRVGRVQNHVRYRTVRKADKRYAAAARAAGVDPALLERALRDQRARFERSRERVRIGTYLLDEGAITPDQDRRFRAEASTASGSDLASGAAGRSAVGRTTGAGRVKSSAGRVKSSAGRVKSSAARGKSSAGRVKSSAGRVTSSAARGTSSAARGTSSAARGTSSAARGKSSAARGTSSAARGKSSAAWATVSPTRSSGARSGGGARPTDATGSVEIAIDEDSQAKSEAPGADSAYRGLDHAMARVEALQREADELSHTADAPLADRDSAAEYENACLLLARRRIRGKAGAA